MSSPHVVAAQIDASLWYKGLLTRPLPSGAWPCTWSDALCHVIGAEEPRNRGKSFAWMLTRAWLDGVIPNGFDAKAHEVFAAFQEKKQKYRAAVRAHGPLTVHEGRAPF